MKSTVNCKLFMSIPQSGDDIREFIEGIYVLKAERIHGRHVQRIRIVWNCIGEFAPSVYIHHTKTSA